MENLKLAHQNARKGKGWYQEVKMVDEDPEKYLGQLQEMLLNKTYNTSDYVTFIKHDSGKDREIFKLPYFPDRICQWAILQVIEPYLIKNLIKNTYSAIPGRGIHLALHDIDQTILCSWNTVLSETGCKKILSFHQSQYFETKIQKTVQR